MLISVVRNGILASSLTVGVALADEPIAAPRSKSAYAPAASSPPAVVAPTASMTTRESMPIDLPTALRLANSNSPAIGFARARLAEALAIQDRADLLILPNLTAGATYYRLDGQTQNQRGEVFTVSRSNLFAAGAVQLRLDIADAYFQPLITRRLTSAADATARAAVIATEFDAASAYLDLLQVHGALAINADTLTRAEQMLKYSEDAEAAGMSKTKGDINRARTEVYVRRQERIDLTGRAGAASARLARILLLEPSVDLQPADPAIVPMTLVPPECTLEQLIATAISTRPDLQAERSVQQAAAERERQARLAPFIPKAALEYAGGAFGGGRNSNLDQFDTRGVAGAQLFWELNNLGFGDAARVRERQAVVSQIVYRIADLQARAGAEVSESAKVAAARFDALDDAQKAVTEAIELYRKLQETSINMIGQRAYDSVEPLLAIQALNTARLLYLNSVIEFNRAQFRLYAAMGQPPECALPTAHEVHTTVPVMPATEK